MNDSRNQSRALWCRQLSGEKLSDTESLTLQDALRGDADLRRELSDDATSHALLRSVNDVVQTEDHFVMAVMQRANQGQDAELVAANLSPPAPAGETNSTRSLERESRELPMLAENRGSYDQRENNRQRSQQWMSLVLTLALFLSVGLILWLQGQEQTEIAGIGPSPQEQNVEQKPVTPLQDDQPKSVNEGNVATTDDVNPVDGEASEDPDHSPLQIATNDIAPAPASPEENFIGLESPDMIEKTPPVVATQSFATLTKVENPVWEREDTVGSRVGAEVVRLFGGTVELTFDDGAVVTLQGPVEFQPLATGQLSLRRGRLTATVPKPAIGFTVLTPTSAVVDLGTEFDVSVKDTGASDVIIRKGEVEVAPGGRTGKDIQKWKLVPGGLNRAVFYARPDHGKPGPIVAKAQGARGQFRGIISMDGKTAKFRSEDTFNNVHESVMTQLKKPQDGMQRQWQDFVDSMQKQMRGTMNFNGQQMLFGNLDEVMRLQNQLQNQLNFNAATPFKGSIKINGEVIQFKTREEFEAARRTAFGPAANFGAGDISKGQRGPR